MQEPFDPKSDTPEIRRRRGGRPTAEQAGNVDRRILDAATDLFLRLGFDATSCDQVVTQAGAGKASLYARYANKEELFEAVVRRMMDRTPVQPSDVPWHLSLHERLQAVGHSLLAQALDTETVALMRVLMTVANRMPQLAGLNDQIWRNGGIESVARAIVGRDAAPEAIKNALPDARLFIDLVLVPQQMRALLGGDPAELQAEGAQTIDQVIDRLFRSG